MPRPGARLCSDQGRSNLGWHGLSRRLAVSRTALPITLGFCPNPKVGRGFRSAPGRAGGRHRRQRRAAECPPYLRCRAMPNPNRLPHGKFWAPSGSTPLTTLSQSMGLSNGQAGSSISNKAVLTGGNGAHGEIRKSYQRPVVFGLSGGRGGGECETSTATSASPRRLPPTAFRGT